MASTTPSAPPSLTLPPSQFARLQPHAYLLAHLSPPASSNQPSIRANGRAPSQFRVTSANTGSLTHTNGSAVVRVGGTTAVCGDDAEVEDPEDETHIQQLNLLVPNLSLSTGCAPGFVPGAPPSALAQSLSHKILNLLHSTKLEKEIKAFWVLYIDIMIISLAGNPFDAAWASVLAALRDTKLPRAWWDVDNEMVVCSDAVSESQKLSLRGLPRRWILADPDGYEEGLSQERVCIVVDKEQGGKGKTVIQNMEKNGGWAVDGKELKALVDISAQRWEQLKHILEQC
ncbi:uncharacterized protein An12g08670 [Aspergillus niger]|uniref:Ribosomal RNA-processing protein 43 n=2 Tax=Aspergillus niger TaxID=5061 RepID=A2R0H9_ASPNC|nr:uncharacterized protein An12g08670 [Aspergillus niger]CAK41317.1 unnamed protein product [Aspergillus niger]